MQVGDERPREGRFEPLVLCYHAVSDSWNHELAVAPLAFERQMRHLLARGRRPGSVAQILPGQGRLFHVTFDDAFSNIARVYGAIERLGVRASVFAVTELADNGGVFDRGNLSEDLEGQPEELVTMNWDALRDSHERGIEVGSHTRSHPHLTTLSDADLSSELRESRERLEDELRVPCRWLAYPFGSHDERVRQAAARAGYEAAFALPGRLTPRDPLAIPRVGVWRTDRDPLFRLKTSGLGRRIATSSLLSGLGRRALEVGRLRNRPPARPLRTDADA